MDNLNTEILNNVIMRYKSTPPTTTSSPKQPIDKVRDFLDSDLEEKGYFDAQSNSEYSNLQKKINELKAQGKLLCDSAIENYEDENSEIKSNINGISSTGQLEVIEKLKAQIEKNQRGIKGVEEIKKTDLPNDNMPVYASYRRGFEKWRRAIAEKLLTN